MHSKCYMLYSLDWTYLFFFSITVYAITLVTVFSPASVQYHSITAVE